MLKASFSNDFEQQYCTTWTARPLSRISPIWSAQNKIGDKPWSSGLGGGLMTHIQEDVGLNPTIYWMDVSNASYYIFIEKKKGIKVAKWGTPKKIINI